MKARSTRSLRRLLFKLRCSCDSTEQIGELEKALARKPERLQLDLLGNCELAPDTALLIRSILLDRAPKTQLITNARSSLQGGGVLVWLLGDTRLIREDAKLHFRKPSREEDEDEGDWRGRKEEEAEMDLEEANYEQVLEYINSYLPVKELSGRPIGVATLRQFGLVHSEMADRYLAAVFERNVPVVGRSEPATGRNRAQPDASTLGSSISNTPTP